MNEALSAPVSMVGRMSPVGFSLVVGAVAAVVTAAGTAAMAVWLAYCLGGADAVAGHLSSDSHGSWLSEPVRIAVVQSQHAMMRALINCGLLIAIVVWIAAGFLARRVPYLAAQREVEWRTALADGGMPE